MVQVRCTGTEDRLLDCYFPGQLGGDNNGRGVTVTDESCNSSPELRLAVICRRFELLGTLTWVTTVAHMRYETFKCTDVPS